MAYALLGSPKPQFFDSSGSPLASGTLAILNPTNDTNKASYPTAADADAETNANSNPITLDSRGEPATGLFGRDDETYKLVLKDSDAVTVWTVTDIRVPSREPHYAETAQTLTDAGAVSLTTPVTWVVTTGAAALTLADGTEGQRKFIVMKTDAGIATLTPTNLANGSTIVFDDVGDSANLLFANAAWHWIGGTATLTGKAESVVTFTSTDATPTVGVGNWFITAGTTAITDFDDGVLGQTIQIEAASSITITDNAAIELDRGANFDMVSGDTLTLTMFVDQVWTEVSRSRVTADAPGVREYGGTVQTLTGAGAVNLTSAVTHVVTTAADALTLADGTSGQRKFIVMKTDGGDGTLTPTNLGNGSTITFDDVGDSADLIFTNGAWHMIGGTATLA